MKCDFCERPEIKERTIIENKRAWAFPSAMPIVPGHTILVPKRCVLKYDDLDQDEKIDLEELRVKLCGALKKVFSVEGFNFAWNEGEYAGQSVPHFHLHIVPRKPGDKGVQQYELRQFLYRPGNRPSSPKEELQEVAKLISEAM